MDNADKLQRAVNSFLDFVDRFGDAELAAPIGGGTPRIAVRKTEMDGLRKARDEYSRWRSVEESS